MATDNVFGAEVYKEEWETKLQEMLDEETKWKDICKVLFTNSYIYHHPFLTDTTVISGTRNCSTEAKDITLSDDDVTVSTYRTVKQYVDRADMAQITYLDQMDIAARQALLLNETIESAIYSAMGSATDFGTEGFTDTAGSTAITVSSSNIDDIIRGVKREIRQAGGETMLERYGGFFVWRPADLEILEGVAQANGYSTADTALINGVPQGFKYMGMTHYSSNLLTASHVCAGVKKQMGIAILKATYGKLIVDDKNPEGKDGVMFITRVDYGTKIWNNASTILFDINVA